MDNLVNVSIVPVLIGVLEVFKKLGIPTKYVPLISVLLGIVLGLALNGFSVEAGLKGLAFGLSACGLYSGAKNTIENM